MTADKTCLGQANQSLYFARLQLDSAEVLSEQTSGNGSFYRQQQQCHCEAAVDNLYRALFFIVAYLLQGRVTDKAQLISPPQLIEALQREVGESSSSLANELLMAIQGQGELALMLKSYMSHWQSRQASKSDSNAIAVTQVNLGVDDCRAWHKALTALCLHVAEDSAEY